MKRIAGHTIDTDLVQAEGTIAQWVEALELDIDDFGGTFPTWDDMYEIIVAEYVATGDYYRFVQAV